MILIRDILYKVTLEKVVGNTAMAIREIHFDSRKVGLDDVFVATRGTLFDGHNFIKAAVDKGAIAVVCEEIPEQTVNGVTYVQVSDTQLALAIMASNYYQSPSSNLK